MEPVYHRVALGVALALAIFALSASAVLASPTPKPACLKTAASQTAMNQCAALWLSHAQARLAKILARERTKLPTTVVNASQAAWNTYRNAECRAEAAAYRGGSIYPLIYLTCEVYVTDARIALIQHVLANLPP